MTSLLLERRTLYSLEFPGGKHAFGRHVMPDQWLFFCDARARWKYLQFSVPIKGLSSYGCWRSIPTPMTT